MKKKFNSSRSSSRLSNLVDSKAQEQVMGVLDKLEQKICNSPALNGGFDALMFKVEKIEESQEKIVVQVNSIHEAVYHPDDGLFARIKDIEHVKEKAESVDVLEKDVLKLQQWHIIDEKTSEKRNQISDEHEKLVNAHDDDIKELIKFKERIVAILKWGAGLLAGAILGGLGNLVYQVIVLYFKTH